MFLCLCGLCVCPYLCGLYVCLCLCGPCTSASMHESVCVCVHVQETACPGPGQRAATHVQCPSKGGSGRLATEVTSKEQIKQSIRLMYSVYILNTLSCTCVSSDLRTVRMTWSPLTCHDPVVPPDLRVCNLPQDPPRQASPPPDKLLHASNTQPLTHLVHYLP